MKKIIITVIVALGMSVEANAQIPNAGFENWTTVGSYEIPDSWGNMNHTTASYSVFTATKATPGSPGTSYLKLTSKTTGSFVSKGIAVSGKLDTLTMLPKSGVAFTQRPATFTGKWQHMIYGSSQGSVKVLTTRWNANTNMRDTVAHAEQALAGMAMSWANFSMNLNYMDSLNYPDSCIIVLEASGSNPTNNDYLWVDNLAFTGTVAVVVHTVSTVGVKEVQGASGSFSLFPNPVNEVLQIKLPITQAQSVTIQMLDITGKVLYSKTKDAVSGDSTEKIDVKNFPKGTYFVKIHGKNVSETKKIVIE
jgi:hypothetical protein